MASLLERMNVDTGSVGPQRSKARRGHSSSPYSRPPKGDINEKWTHDQFNATNSLLDRLGTAERAAPPKTNFTGAVRALRQATGQPVAAIPLSIRGASKRNVVEVSGLVPGTTADDVRAIFKQCGTILSAKEMTTHDGVTVQLTFKLEDDAADAVRKFDKQVADGRELKVTFAGIRNTTLPGRIDSIDSESVDSLMPSSAASKMRSDEILRDEQERARAHVLTAPPGSDPREYTSTSRERGRGRRGQRRGGDRPRGGRGGEKMDMD